MSQLCWTCKRATGACPWSKGEAPVKGWTAARSVIVQPDGKRMRSYRITACPLYEPDEKRRFLTIRELTEFCKTGKKINLSTLSDDAIVSVAKLAGYDVVVCRTEGNKRKLLIKENKNGNI